MVFIWNDPTFGRVYTYCTSLTGIHCKKNIPGTQREETGRKPVGRRRRRQNSSGGLYYSTTGGVATVAGPHFDYSYNIRHGK